MDFSIKLNYCYNIKNLQILLTWHDCTFFLILMFISSLLKCLHSLPKFLLVRCSHRSKVARKCCLRKCTNNVRRFIKPSLRMQLVFVTIKCQKFCKRYFLLRHFPSSFPNVWRHLHLKKEPSQVFSCKLYIFFRTVVLLSTCDQLFLHLTNLAKASLIDFLNDPERRTLSNI